jgi:hypothetical protein
MGKRSTPPRLRLEALEDRVVPSWAGVPPRAITPPAAVAVTLDPQHDAQGNAAITANEVDSYSFVAPVTGSYRLSALTPPSSLDTVLGLFDASGARVAYNDDISASNRDSQLTATLTAGARYYFGVTNYTGTPGGAYTWQVDGPSSAADDGFENNDTFAQAANLGTMTARRTISNLVLADSADWFRFTTSAAGTAASSVSISFLNSQGNLNLELYNSAGQRQRFSAGTGNGETVSLSGLAAGTYYVRVYGAANPSYTLDIVPPAAASQGFGGVSPPTHQGSFDITLRLTGLTASQQAIFRQAAARWQQIIIGDLPAATYQGVAVDDVLIDASAMAIDGAGGVLGEAGPDALRAGSHLPIHGTMEFDTADLVSLESSGQLYEVVLHEMGHVLGIGTIWQQLGLLTGAGTTNPRFTGAQATAAYNALFGTNATSVPVEGLPSEAGSRDSHWRESVFGAELMTPYISGAGNPISRVTVASLADLGYTVNLAAADAYTPPSASRARSTAATTSRGSGTSLRAAESAAATTTDIAQAAGILLIAGGNAATPAPLLVGASASQPAQPAPQVSFIGQAAARPGAMPELPRARTGKAVEGVAGPVAGDTPEKEVTLSRREGSPTASAAPRPSTDGGHQTPATAAGVARAGWTNTTAARGVLGAGAAGEEADPTAPSAGRTHPPRGMGPRHTLDEVFRLGLMAWGASAGAMLPHRTGRQTDEPLDDAPWGTGLPPGR